MVSEARPTAGIAPHDVAAPGPCASGRGASSRQPRSPLRWDIAACVLLGLASFLIYNANLRSIPAVDTYAARYLPFSIWRNHTVVLDPIADTVAQGRKISTSDGQADAAWWIRKGREDHLISFYPIVVPLIVAPLYLPAVAYLEAHGWDPLLLDHVARIMEKLCASLIAAAPGANMIRSAVVVAAMSEPPPARLPNSASDSAATMTTSRGQSGPQNALTARAASFS